MNWIITLFLLSWVASFTSQSLIDLVDGLIIFTSLGVAYKRSELKLLFTNFRPAALWLLWLAVLVIGLIINVGITNTKPWIDFLEFRWILTFLGLIYLYNQIKSEELLLKPLFVIILALNIIALIIYLKDEHWRAGGILKQTMAFSHNIAPVFCLFTVFMVSQWKALSSKLKVLIFFAAGTAGALTLFTYTRGVWIGSLFGILITMLIWGKRAFFISLISSVIIVGALMFTHKGISDRALNKTTNETQSNNERLALWKGNLRIIQDHPVFGVGFGQNKYHLRKYYDEMGYPPGQRESHAHNQYLQMWGGTGTLGLLCFLAFFFLILKKTYDGFNRLEGQQQSLQLGLLAAVICFMMGALTESNFNIAKNRFFFLVFAAWAVSRYLKSRNEDNIIQHR